MPAAGRFLCIFFYPSSILSLKRSLKASPIIQKQPDEKQSKILKGMITNETTKKSQHTQKRPLWLRRARRSEHQSLFCHGLHRPDPFPSHIRCGAGILCRSVPLSGEYFQRLKYGQDTSRILSPVPGNFQKNS